MALAPIVLFVYNRPGHTEKTLSALAANDLAAQSELFIYADGPKPDAGPEDLLNIKKTRDIAKKQKWCKNVTLIESANNKGLANSIIHGVTEIANKYGKLIVLEDDLVTHPFFLTYMNTYLDVYENNDQVISIHGYIYPVKKKIDAPFFIKGADCWGWGTWKRGWSLFETDAKLLFEKLNSARLVSEFNFNNSYNYLSLLKGHVDGTIDSWAIRWYASAFLLNKLTLYPPVSLVKNIGRDGSGTHKDSDANDIEKLATGKFELKVVKAIEDKKNKKQIETFFLGDNSLIKSIKRKLRFLIPKKA